VFGIRCQDENHGIILTFGSKQTKWSDIEKQTQEKPGSLWLRLFLKSYQVW
jgi:hypothetical protein